MTDSLTDAVMQAAFPTPGRIEPETTDSGPCTDGDCEHRAWGNPTLAADYMDGGR